MKQLLVRNIRELINGQLIQGSDKLPIKHVRYTVLYNKRVKRPNTLIFARFKKNMFECEMVQSLMPCAIVTDRFIDKLMEIQGCSIIKVKNTKAAYWKFVDYYRNLFQIPVVAVTGTAGKTTTKNMIKHILKHTHKVHGTFGANNNRLGHFNNLLKIDDTTEAAVFETAVGLPGDIIYSSKFFKPTIGVITNIGVAHQNRCKTPEKYLQAKAEMVTALNENGVLVLNADDENTKRINLKKFKGRIVYFSIHNSANFQASNIQYGENGMNFLLTFQNMKYPVFVPGYGEHQVYNALATFAVVNELGVRIKEAAEQLRSFKNMIRHLQIIPGIGSSTIIDDTWNSTPNSLKAGLEVLNKLASGRKKVVLIGNLSPKHEVKNPHFEPGEKSYQYYYRQVGKMIADSGVDILITFGDKAAEIAAGASEKGLTGEIHTYNEVADLYQAVEEILDKNTLLFLKCGAHNITFLGLIKKIRIKNK